jgi:hypothetical protein
MTRPNQRLKLSGCGGRLKGKRSFLIAAAAPRSLSAIRSGDASRPPNGPAAVVRAYNSQGQG